MLNSLRDFFLIAEIIKISNPEGFLLIRSFSDFPDRFFNLDKVSIEIFGGKKEFTVEKVKKVGNSFVIKFKGFNSAESVKFLLGKQIFVSVEDAVKPEEDVYFIHDLIGSKVYQNELFFGELTDVFTLHANDVYVVVRADGREILVPALKEFILSFDAKKKRLDLSEKYCDDENEN